MCFVSVVVVLYLKVAGRNFADEVFITGVILAGKMFMIVGSTDSVTDIERSWSFFSCKVFFLFCLFLIG